MALRQLIPRALAATFAAGLSLAAARPAHALSGFLEVPPHEEVVASPAYRYANMTNDEAFAELDRRNIPYVKVAAIGGVRAPIRLKGRLNGVDIHSSLSVEERKESMFEVLDARLALALDDFCVILARHDIVEVVHYTMYRPNVPPPGSEPAGALVAKNGKADDTKTKNDARTKNDAKGKERSDRQPGKRRASLDGKAAKSGKNAHRATSGSETKKKEGLEKDFELTDDRELEHDQQLSHAELAKGAPPKAAPATKPSAAAKPSAQSSAKARRAPGSRKPAKTRILPKSEEHAHGKWAPPGTRHPAGLAIDVGILKRQDGSTLNVAAHFLGKIGERTCGEGAREPDTKDARELRSIVCEARESEVFTYALTPNFNADHFDHFHFEIKPQVEWFLFH